MFLLGLVIAILLVIFWFWHRNQLCQLHTRQAKKLKELHKELEEQKTALEQCVAENSEAARTSAASQKVAALQADLDTANSEIKTLMDSLLLHHKIAEQLKEVADGYKQPSHTYRGFTRQMQQRAGSYYDDDHSWKTALMYESVRDRDAEIERLRTRLSGSRAKSNGLMRDLYTIMYGGVRYV